MSILVIGGTGKTGSATLRALHRQGAVAVAAARRAGPGVVGIDINHPDMIEAAARGHAAAYLLTPLGPDESAIGVAAVAALRRAGVRKIVYLAIMNLETMRAIPHFASKIAIRDAVLSDGRSVVLEANFFMDNDAMLLPAIIHGGVYPLPVGDVGVWSIAAADIGEAAANALFKDDWNGQAVPLCGSERLTGAELAASWSAAAGRPVVYGGDDTAPFLAATGMPDGWMRDDLRIMFEVTQQLGCIATPAQVAASAAIIGRLALGHREFASTLYQESQP
ncbi:MAG: SDR family oxidoreductase [Polymorphobacter sp.]